MRALLFLLFAMLSVQRAWSQGAYWQATGEGGFYGDPYTACYASHQSFSANAGLTPNEYSLDFTNEGFNHAISCKWNRGEPGYWGTSGSAYLKCPTGTHRTGDSNYCGLPKFGEGPCTGNPIDIQSGTKKQVEMDFSVGRGRLNFARTYSSELTTATVLGRGWSSNFHPMVQSAYSWYYGYFTFRMENGQLLRFRRVGQSPVWKLAGVIDAASGWEASTLSTSGRKDLPGYAIVENSGTSLTLHTPDRVERDFVFPSAGSANVKMTEIRHPDGYEVELNYNAGGLLESVSDTDGSSILFEYTANGALEKATTPDGASYHYEYEHCPSNGCPAAMGSTIGDAWRNNAVLKHVVFPDATPLVLTDNPKIEYHYEVANDFSFLTGRSDERGVRTNWWDYVYGATGWRATSSEGPFGRELSTITEVVAGTTFKVINALGKEADYTFGLVGPARGKSRKLLSVEGVASPGCVASNSTQSYSGNGHLLSSVAEEGQTTTRTPDAVSGLPSAIVEGAGSPQQETTNFTWDAAIRKPTLIQRQGLTAVVTYGADWSIEELELTDTTSHTVPYPTNGQVRQWTYTWLPGGLLESVDGPLAGTSDTINFTYDLHGNLSSVTNEVGHITTINSVDTMGRPLQVTEPSGRVTVFSYTPRGWLEEVVINPGGSQRLTSFTYDEAGNLTRIDAPGSRWAEYDYDDSGCLIEARSSAGGKIAYDYDLLGNVIAADFQSTGGASQADFTYTYDELGRLRSLLGGAGDAMLLAYDRSNRLTTETDGLGRTWLTAFDPLDRVISVTDPDTDVEEQIWSTAGHVSAFEDGRSLVTSFVRNGFGEVIREVSPDRGTTDYWYDDAGRLTKVLTAAGRDTRYTYDDAGRLLTRTFPNESALDLSFTYDSVAGGNPGIGELTGISGNVSGRSYTYNLFGEMTGESWSIDAQTYNIGYTYSASGDLEKITYPSGRTAEYSYDSAGRTTGIGTRPTAMGSLQSVVASAIYDPFGPLSGYVFGNGVTASIENDASYRTARIHLTNSGGSVLDKTYTYDANSRVTGIADAVTPSVSAVYTYHLDGRLRRATGAWGEVEWTYDAVGNRVLEEEFSGGSFLSSASYNYPGGSNKLSDTVSDLSAPLSSFTHTADGNVASETAGSTVTAYTYSEASRLAGITRNSTLEAEFAYDAFERRVRRSTASGVSHFVFLPDGRLIGEYDGATGAVIREYVWMDDRLVGQVDGAGTPHYIQTGPLGQPLIVTDAGGSVAWRGELSPFGELVVSTGTGPLPDARFLGQWDEAGSGLYQNWHRTYDASLGRYLEADPLGLAAGQSLYGYVKQDPKNAVDPLGLEIRVGYNPAFGGTGTHAYLYSTDYGVPIGRNGAYGQGSAGAPLTTAEAMKDPYVPVRLPRGLNEEDVMTCISNWGGWNQGWYVPWADDCQTQVSEALMACGVPDPPLVPTGRTPIDENVSRPFGQAEKTVTEMILDRYGLGRGR